MNTRGPLPSGKASTPDLSLKTLGKGAGEPCDETVFTSYTYYGAKRVRAIGAAPFVEHVQGQKVRILTRLDFNCVMASSWGHETDTLPIPESKSGNELSEGLNWVYDEREFLLEEEQDARVAEALQVEQSWVEKASKRPQVAKALKSMEEASVEKVSAFSKAERKSIAAKVRPGQTLVHGGRAKQYPKDLGRDDGAVYCKACGRRIDRPSSAAPCSACRWYR